MLLNITLAIIYLILMILLKENARGSPHSVLLAFS
jgi:hypothetical protein